MQLKHLILVKAVLFQKINFPSTVAAMVGVDKQRRGLQVQGIPIQPEALFQICKKVLKVKVRS